MAGRRAVLHHTAAMPFWTRIFPLLSLVAAGPGYFSGLRTILVPAPERPSKSIHRLAFRGGGQAGFDPGFEAAGDDLHVLIAHAP